MHPPTQPVGDPAPRAAVVVVAGLAALAVAMGIGRFAFTPILPMMEADAGLSLRAAGWLAAANYLGYLLGALHAARLPPAWALRGGLLLIALATFAMGLVHVLALQLVLRLAAGLASAWVLVHVSAWSLARFAEPGRRGGSGLVYAGVGLGVAAAGLVVMGTMQLHWGPDRTWQLFGVIALLASLAMWRVFRDGASAAARPSGSARVRIAWDSDKRRLLWCYAMLGIGYIIPATFLPEMAHRFIADPRVFGLAWPVFGAAAALSTWVAGRWLSHVDDRRLWAVCYLLMLTGVALPALWPTLAAILVAALLVGGTFMVVTMLGLREARRVGGAAATAFIGLMTAAFAVGQVIGPLVVSALAHRPGGFTGALLGAALLLGIAAVSLWRSAGSAQARPGARART